MIATLDTIRAIERYALDDCSLHDLQNGAEDVCEAFEQWCADIGCEPVYDNRTEILLGQRAAAVANVSDFGFLKTIRARCDEAERRHPFHQCSYQEAPLCAS